MELDLIIKDKNVFKMKNLVLTFVCIIFLISSISAFDFDNKLNEPHFTFDGKSIKGNKLLEQYNPIEIKNSFGYGKTLFQGYLSQHTYHCSDDCSSTLEIKLEEDGVLIEDIIFKDEKGSLTSIKNYQFFVNDKPYNLNQRLKKGIYQVRLEGEKDYSKTVDWIIKSQGKWINEWAVWGGLFEGTEYQLSILADSISEAGLEINDVVVTELATGVYKVNTTNADDEISRALIMKTLFFGTTGSDPRATIAYVNATKIYSRDSRDGGKRGHYLYVSTGAGYVGTFADTSNNNNCSSWSKITLANVVPSGGQWEMPNGEVLHQGVTLGTSDEFGTDTSGDEKTNPTDCEIYLNYGGESGNIRVVILSAGEISWTNSPSHTDFYTDESFPIITFTEVEVTLNSPINNYNSSSQEVTFNCSTEIIGNTTVSNISLWTDQSGNWQQENITSGLSGTSEVVTWNHNILSDGNYLWACKGCDDEGNCEFSSENRTIIIDVTYPSIEIDYPISNPSEGFIGENETLNWTIEDTRLDACWYDYNNTNITLTCNDNTTSFELIEDWYNITLWTNDTSGNTNSSFLEWDYKVLINSQSYETSTYETAAETFTVNVTANSSLTTANLVYNTVSHTSTKSGTIYTSTFDIPSSTGDKSFYWDFTYAGSSINSGSYSQFVNTTLFGLCNASVNLTVPYINFTFMDEETLSYINATIDSSTWTYYLGDGTVTKELLFSNNTVNENYAFCFTASNNTLHNSRSIQYASPGYPQRKYDSTSDLTNATTNKTLYLLSSTDGIYSTIQVIDEQGDQVSGVEVTAERQFSGIWTIVGQEITDSAGAVTFWVNPDYDHRFTFISDDCADNTVTVRPTQTQYTQQLQCGIGGDIYVTPIEGIRYSRTPAGGLIVTGEHNFTFEVASSKDNIVNVSMEIVNATNGNLLASNWSSCSTSGGTIYVLYTVGNGDDIKGKYYLDLGNGSFLLEGDAHWINVLGPNAFDGKSGVRTFWKDMVYVFQEWGDDSNTADFNRLIVIFFLMCISLSVLNLHFNIDTMNPGAFMTLLTMIVLMGSLVGGVSSQGFFYFNNLVSISRFGEQGSNFINNYILFFFCFIITISYWLNVNKQAQR